MRDKIVCGLTVMIFLLTGSVSFSATEHRINRLGNPGTTFYAPPLRSVEDLQKMMQVSKAGISEEILVQRNWHGNIEDLLRAVESGKVSEAESLRAHECRSWPIAGMDDPE